MKYLSLYTPRKTPGVPPSPESMARMEKLIEESTKSGALLATGGLMLIAKGGARLRRAGDEIAVIDGPFREEMMEMVGNFLSWSSQEIAISHSPRRAAGAVPGAEGRGRHNEVNEVR